MNRGRLIAFEGIDGCGKSTQVARLAAAFQARGEPVVVTHEPTDGPTGQRIRTMARSGQAVAPEEELSWFLEDRRAHVAEVIRPALAAGTIVLTDRYFLSTVAYQGARGLDPVALLELNESEFPLPDLALLLEISVEGGLARVGARTADAEPVFEHRGFLEQVAAIFSGLDRPYLVRVDASPDPKTVHEAVVEIVRARLAIP